MAKTLRELYPSVRSRHEILQDIMDTPNLKETFMGWSEEHQNHFLDFCSGAKGVKMLYDGFFKEIMNPDSKPQRLEELLSLLLKQKIKILHALPNESSNFSSDNTLLIMDIVIQLEDGSIANVECQRIGYLFMGQRAACYSADLLIRQLKRVRDKKKKEFSYLDMKKVYNIIFYEDSINEFAKYPDDILHHFKQMSNTGLELELLQEYIFIPLDIVNQIYQNKGGTNNKLEAWLIFLSNDDPEIIQKLISEYPDFENMYREVFMICKNTEQVMNMFSEELKILDRNSFQLLLEKLKTDNKQKEAELKHLLEVNEQRNSELQQLQAVNDQKNSELQQLQAVNDQKTAEVKRLLDASAQKDAEIEQLKKQIAELKR